MSKFWAKSEFSWRIYFHLPGTIWSTLDSEPKLTITESIQKWVAFSQIIPDFCDYPHCVEPNTPLVYVSHIHDLTRLKLLEYFFEVESLDEWRKICEFTPRITNVLAYVWEDVLKP